MMQIHFAQLLNAFQRMSGQQHFQYFIEQARLRHVVEQVFHCRDGRGSGRIQLDAQLGRQAHCAQHAHRVFAVTHQRITNDAQQMAARVGITAVIIVDLLCGGIVKQRVGGEIAARRILFLVAEFIVAQQAAMFVGLRIFGFDHAAESRYLHHLFAEHHMHQPKAPPDDARTAKHAAHLLRGGIGGDIEILGNAIQQ